MVSEDEIRESIKKLRERRASIPELRDYRPQKHKGGSTKPSKPAKAPAKPVIEEFGDLFKRGEEGGDSNGTQ